MSGYTDEQLAQISNELRERVLQMIAKAGSGHPGGSLSAADIMTYLFYEVLRLDPQHPKWPDRDRFILAKGHAAPILYALLAKRGFFPEAWLETLRQLGSPLQGHPSMKDTPGVEASTGSLGQGLSFGVGVALAGKLDQKDYRVYVLLGDGEVQEGQVWEAAMAAAKFRLDNLTAILDYNGVQSDGKVPDVMPLEPLADKWRAFGWAVWEIDGHNFADIRRAVTEARGVRGQPAMIVAHTVKGKGVSFMEHRAEWHGKAPSAAELATALTELHAHRQPAGDAGASGKGREGEDQQ